MHYEVAESYFRDMDKSVQVNEVPYIDESEPPLQLYDEVKAMADYLTERTKHRPTIGMVLGSGLGGMADLLEDMEAFSYKDIKGFPVTTAPGHRGRLLFGRLAGKVVVCMQGRLHPYEGFPVWKCCIPIRLMKLLNVTKLIVTNAAGSIHPEYNIGDMMIIKDHINMPGMAGDHPLKGPNDDRFGPRFPALNHVYDKELRELGRTVGESLNLTEFLREGCYAMQCGPSFETISEARVLRMLGGDVVGMSTVHETITASHCGMRVFGLSLVTNNIVTSEDDDAIVTSAEVYEIARKRSDMLRQYIFTFVKEIRE